MGLNDIEAVELALKASLSTSFEEPEAKLAKAFEVIVNVVREQVSPPHRPSMSNKRTLHTAYIPYARAVGALPVRPKVCT